AALVADRAVQRVVDEQELHHPLARLLDHRGIGPDLLAGDVHGRQVAGGGGLGRTGPHFYEAHAAVAGDRQPLVVAEARKLLAGQFADLEDVHPLLELDLDTVDLGRWHAGADARPFRLESLSLGVGDTRPAAEGQPLSAQELTARARAAKSAAKRRR